MKQFCSFELVLAAALVYIIGLTGVDSANCASYPNSTSCEVESACAWSHSSSSCYCAANVTMDICFALDSSGSIGSDDFEIELEWLSDFVETSISSSSQSRLGIINFSTRSRMILNFSDSESMSSSELSQFIENDIEYYDAFTNTVGAIKQALVMFDKQSSDDALKVFVIMTDGNPKMPNNGDTDVCALSADLKAADINTYILGVGNNWNPDNVDCLVDDEDTDILYVTSFDYDEFDEILPELAEITCPSSYEIVITEVKVESDDTNGRTVPFIEIYNQASDIILADLTFKGVVQGEATTDTSVILPQGSYLVLYDAEYASNGNTGENVTCQDCDCGKTSNGYYCNASYALYIGCDGSNDGCSFNDAKSNSDWNVRIEDNSKDNEILDRVVYDASTFPNLTALIGYSFELTNKGWDNDEGANWQKSCNKFGTPGDDPIDDCTETCDIAECKANGASDVSVSGTSCDCDNEPHYYDSGCSCVKVQPPSDCVMSWKKNGTERYWRFEWEKAPIDDTHQYKLGYCVKNGGFQYVELYADYKRVSDYDDTRDWTLEPGTVQTKMNGALSIKINCTSETQIPTEEPTNRPSVNPTRGPSNYPTISPTYESPYLYIGGDICEEDRCDCYDDARNCTGDEITNEWSEGASKFVTVEQRPITFPHKTLVYWSIEFLGETDTDEGDNDEGDNDDDDRRRLSGMRKILSQHYDVVNDNSVFNSHLGGRSRQLLPSTSYSMYEVSTTLGDASSDITPIAGYINVSYDSDASTNNGKISLYVNADGDDTDSEFELFRLTLVNCSTFSNEYECELVYPSQFYILLENSDSGLNTSVTENEMPAWLWWLIIGLVVFLFVLGWLVYRYWWKNKETSSALQTTQDDLDEAIEEAEGGFAHGLGQGDVQFNPMATGIPGQTSTMNPMQTEMDRRANEIQNDRANVAAEKFRMQEQFGPVQGRLHKTTT